METADRSRYDEPGLEADGPPTGHTRITTLQQSWSTPAAAAYQSMTPLLLQIMKACRPVTATCVLLSPTGGSHQVSILSLLLLASFYHDVHSSTNNGHELTIP